MDEEERTFDLWILWRQLPMGEFYNFFGEFNKSKIKQQKSGWEQLYNIVLLLFTQLENLSDYDNAKLMWIKFWNISLYLTIVYVS